MRRNRSSAPTGSTGLDKRSSEVVRPDNVNRYASSAYKKRVELYADYYAGVTTDVFIDDNAVDELVQKAYALWHAEFPSAAASDFKNHVLDYINGFLIEADVPDRSLIKSE